MGRGDDDRGRPAVRKPTLAGAVTRALAGTALAWAIRPILGLLAIALAVGLFAAWGLVLVAFGLIAGALGLTSSGSVATPVILGVLIVSAVLMVPPTRWAVRNLLRAEGTLERTADRLPTGQSATASGVGAAPPRAARITPAELAALDARLAKVPSDAGQGAAEQPDR